MLKLSELKISPAPWDFQPNHPDGPRVADRWNSYVCGGLSMRHADSRIDAAAPKLYDALYEFVSYAERHAPLEAGLNPIIDKARAALAEAAGEGEVK